LAGTCAAAAPAPTKSPRVLSFDQCADQFVLALSPREKIVGLSTRADDADSRLRARARGLPLRRVDLESALAVGPELVVRSWGGDPALVRALRARGVRVVSLGETNSFADIRRNIRQVAAELGRVPQGEQLVAEMDARLARAAGTWQGRSALYLTPSGVTAGSGTLVDAVLRAAGMTNAEPRAGFQTVSLETMALHPPQAVVLAFFDTFQLSGASWGPGRHQVLRRIVRERAVASLPGDMMGCPDWAAAEAAELLAASAPRNLPRVQPTSAGQ